MAFWDNIFKGDDLDSDELFWDDYGNPDVDISIDDDDDDMDDDWDY